MVDMLLITLISCTVDGETLGWDFKAAGDHLNLQIIGKLTCLQACPEGHCRLNYCDETASETLHSRKLEIEAV